MAVEGGQDQLVQEEQEPQKRDHQEQDQRRAGVRFAFLEEDNAFDIRSCQVLDVSVHEGGRQLRELHANASHRSGFEKENDGDDVVSVFLHCGVDSGSSRFALETRGYNEALFGEPDQKGYCPSSTTIDNSISDKRYFRVTTVPVARILNRLQKVGWGPEDVRESKDAGRFVCNYVYFTSLGLCEKRAGRDTTDSDGPANDHGEVGVSGGLATLREAAGGNGHASGNPSELRDRLSRASGSQAEGNGDKHSLFIHVPPFTVISKQRQLQFLVDCLSATAASLLLPADEEEGDVAASPSASSRKLLGNFEASDSAASLQSDNAGRDRPLRASTQESAGYTGGGGGGGPLSDSNSTGLHGNPQEAESSSAGADARGDSYSGNGDVETDEDEWDEKDLSRTAEEEEETMTDTTRRRLMEAGFDELDVDAAMATTKSESTEVNMQFLLDMAPLLPRGAPTDAEGLYLLEFGNDNGGSGSGDGEERGRNKRGHKSRTMSAGSAAGMMGGVSPKWARDVSPTSRGLRSGLNVPGDGGTSSPGETTGSVDNDNGAKSKGGLLQRFRRHRRGGSTSSAVNEATQEGSGSGDAPSPFNRKSSGSRTSSPEHEYSRQTTASVRSTSPPRTRAMFGNAIGGSARRVRGETSAGWGAPVSSRNASLRLALLVRSDLGMGPGAVAAECCRAALAAARKAETGGGGDTYAVWREAGEAMVVLNAMDAGSLDAVLAVSYAVINISLLCKRSFTGHAYIMLWQGIDP